MRDARRTTFCCGLAALLLTASLSAQTYPNGLATDSVDPRTDATVIREIRRHLDQVRARQKRPVVGLVLSGGGAKGAAEVGALKYIEELGIPIDFVCGTSIGGLVGGFYAMGYRAADLEELFRTQDWNVMLTDRIAPEYIPFSTKMDQATYLLSFPFHNPPERGGEEVRYTMRERRRVLRESMAERSGGSRLAASLPAGYAYGFNVNNLLSGMSVGYQDSLSFARLPIPFLCVAGDVVSSKAKNWGSGSITTAMRSTMSIPGLFNPVRTGGMVLVDGGVRNNFPTDLAKAVGADYLIGIELSDALPGYSDINNIGDILGQFITMLGNDTFAKNIGKSDVLIKPALGEFNMMSFNAEAVDTMLVRGYQAAQAQRAGLLAIRERTGRAKSAPDRRATDISKTPVRLSAIEYAGLGDKEAARMARLTGLDVREPVDRQRIDEAMSRLQATGAFESVTYSLYGSREPYRLVFHCTPAPVHDFKLGLRADTEEGAAVLLGIGLGTRRLSGSKADFRLRVAENLKFNAHYALDLGNLPTLNVSAALSRYRGHLGNASDRLRYDVAYIGHREDFYISGVEWTRLDFRAGISHRGYSLSPNTYFAQILRDQGVALESSYLGAYLQGNFYTLDNYYFPTRGVSLALRGSYDFLRPGHADFTPILKGGVDFRAAIPLGGKWAFVPDVRLRTVSHFGEEVADGVAHTNFVGGSLAARYTEDQVPFFGLNNIMATGDYLVDAVASLRWNPLENLYFSALGGVLIHENSIGELISHPLPDTWALGAEAAYDTIAGPVKFNLHWSDSQGWGAYLSFGFDF